MGAQKKKPTTTRISVMGQSNSTKFNLDKDQLEELVKQSHYDKKEIKQLYKQFIDEAPCGYIPKNDFHQLTELMGIKDAFITSLVFNAFDTNGDGNIQFDEFIRGMSIMTRKEMEKIVSALYKMLGDLVSLQGEEYDTPAKLVDKIFREMDTNMDGKLSLQEYKMGAQKDPSIIQRL